MAQMYIIPFVVDTKIPLGDMSKHRLKLYVSQTIHDYFKNFYHESIKVSVEDIKEVKEIQ